MVALIARQQDRQQDTLKAAIAELPADAGLETVIRNLVRAAMQHHLDNALLASAIDHEEARLPLDTVLDTYLEKAGSIVERLLRARSDVVGAIDPRIAARTLPALVRAVTDTWANLSPPRLDIAEAEAVKAVLGYLRPACCHPTTTIDQCVRCA